MAIDGYYMEALDEAGQAKFVGYRVMAYRIAMMTGTGVIVTVCATAGWFASYLASAGFSLCSPFTISLFFRKLKKRKGLSMNSGDHFLEGNSWSSWRSCVC